MLALLSNRSWVDALWWSITPALAWFVWSAKTWMREEEVAIERLESMRYDAKGA